FDTSAGNPVKEILPKLNLPDHRVDPHEFRRSFSVTCVSCLEVAPPLLPFRCVVLIFGGVTVKVLIPADQYKEESIPVYDTDIEDVIEEEEGFIKTRGFGGEEDNIEDIVVVANNLCS
ncbi:hypothetical protein Tco_0663179, partial [Tanacetum coccineum]